MRKQIRPRLWGRFVIRLSLYNNWFSGQKFKYLPDELFLLCLQGDRDRVN